MFSEEDEREQARLRCRLVHRYPLRLSWLPYGSMQSLQNGARATEKRCHLPPILNVLFPISGFRLSSVSPIEETSFLSFRVEDVSC